MIVRARRGQPIAALAAILMAWVGVRAWGPVDALLEVPLPLPPTVAGRVLPEEPQSAPAPQPTPLGPAAVSLGREPVPGKPPAPAAAWAPPVPAPRPGWTAPQPPALAPASPRSSMSAASRPAATAAQPIPFGAVPPEVRARRRWSADAWVLWREKGRAGAALVGSGTYGASQAGVVLRYRIAPDSRFDPRAYLRATTTLSGNHEVEGAAGLAVRPLTALPLDIMAEGRVLRFFGDPKLRPSETRVRPAAMAVLGPPPVAVGKGFRAEAYAQAGFVGGQGASAFADGQVRVVRDIPSLPPGRFRLEAGLGAWGGAQKGVERLDMGPSAALLFPVGKGLFGRAGIDWRQRVAGKAEPGSGPVLTLSAGF